MYACASFLPSFVWIHSQFITKSSTTSTISKSIKKKSSDYSICQVPLDPITPKTRRVKATPINVVKSSMTSKMKRIKAEHLKQSTLFLYTITKTTKTMTLMTIIKIPKIKAKAEPRSPRI